MSPYRQPGKVDVDKPEPMKLFGQNAVAVGICLWLLCTAIPWVLCYVVRR